MISPRHRAIELLRIPKRTNQQQLAAPSRVVGYDAESGQFLLESAAGNISQAGLKSSGAAGLGDPVLSGGGVAVGRPHVPVPPAGRRSFPRLPGTIKVLFGLVRDGVAQYWIGGDRADPIMIHSHPLEDPASSDFRGFAVGSVVFPGSTFFGWPVNFQSLGSAPDEWCVAMQEVVGESFRTFLRTGSGDLTYPSHASFIPYGTAVIFVDTGSIAVQQTRVVNLLVGVDRIVTVRSGLGPGPTFEVKGSQGGCVYRVNEGFRINYALPLTASRDAIGFSATTSGRVLVTGNQFVCPPSEPPFISYFGSLDVPGTLLQIPGQEVSVHFTNKGSSGSLHTVAAVYSSNSENFTYGETITSLPPEIPGIPDIFTNENNDVTRSLVYFTPNGFGVADLPRETYIPVTEENPDPLNPFRRPGLEVGSPRYENTPSWNQRSTWPVEVARFTAEGLIRTGEITELPILPIPPDAAILAISTYPEA